MTAGTDSTLSARTEARDDHFVDLRNAPREIPGEESVQYRAGDPSPSRAVKQSDLNDLRSWVYGDQEPTTYSYDPAGNRLSITHDITTTYDYDRADRITLVGTTPYTMTANGNLVGRGTGSFAYDQANQLITATVGRAISICFCDP